MGKIFDKNNMNIPELEVIPGNDLELPYFLVPLKNWLMRPYSQKTFMDENPDGLKSSTTLLA